MAVRFELRRVAFLKNPLFGGVIFLSSYGGNRSSKGWSVSFFVDIDIMCDIIDLEFHVCPQLICSKRRSTSQIDRRFFVDTIMILTYKTIGFLE